MKGYVRKRGNKWSYTVDVGRDPITNKRKQKTKSGFESEKEAEAALTEFIYHRNKGLYVEPQNILLKDFALDWLKDHKYQTHDTTSEQVESKVRHWIIPLLGHYKLQDIKPVHAQAFKRKLLDGSAPSTANQTLVVAKMIMKHAINLELIIKNPFHSVTIRVPKRKGSTWTFEELEQFLNYAKEKDDFYYGVCAVAAYTGLRKGEILGISRLNVNDKKNILTINQAIACTKEKGLHIGRVKTSSSDRQIAIDPFVTSILKERIRKNNEMKLKLGKKNYEDNDLVFCHLDGKIFRPSGFNRKFNQLQIEAGVPVIRFHDMRHTHATLLLELDVNPKIVADRLGHSTVKTTLDTYSHPSVEMQANVAEMFAKRVKNM